MNAEEKQALTQERLMQVLSYDPSTGAFTWKGAQGNNTRRNKPAGSKDDGYVKIMLDRNTYRAHRLAFLYMTGEYPDFEVDHINRIRSDNRWSNLRKATHSQNMQNKCAHRNNVSGIKGVNYRKDSGKYRVMMKIGGKLKNFGQYDDLELAELVSSEVRSKYHKEFSLGYEAMVMEKLNKLFALAQRADACGNVIDCVNPHDVIDIAEAFLDMKNRAEAAEAKLVPDGWKLVPVEATEEMIEAGDIWCDGLTYLSSAYEAMIGAAPTPTQ